jgi:ERCC4-type nuclease
MHTETRKKLSFVKKSVSPEQKLKRNCLDATLISPVSTRKLANSRTDNPGSQHRPSEGQYLVRIPIQQEVSHCRGAIPMKGNEAATMPKSPPTPILIRVDTQEERSGIPTILVALPQVQLERVQLEVGDYDVGGNPRRVFERKSASDFVISIEDGRIFEQLKALLATDFAPILLLEGDPLRVHSHMRPEAIYGALTYICAILSVPILPSNGPETSAGLLYSTARQCQIGYAAPGPAVGRRGASISEQQLQVLMALPGVGPTTARALCARFSSLHEVLTADATRLATVPGISAARATTLYHLLHTAFPTSATSAGGEE